MAINFVKKKKKQKYLVIALAVAVPIIIFIFWYGFLREEKSPIDRTAIQQESYPRISINFQVLENPIFDELESFPELPKFSEISSDDKLGRDEPFLPYYYIEEIE